MTCRPHAELMTKATHAFSTLFDDLPCWQVFASGQAEGRISSIVATDGTAGLCLDYDFHGGGGFVAIRRAITIKWPTTFQIGFLLRGEGLANNLEFKVAAPGDADVWRHVCPDLIPPAAWSHHCFTERELPFAWGPAGGGAPSEIAAVEFVVAAGSGGKGTLQIASPFLVDQTLQKPVAIRTSSQHAGCSTDFLFTEGSVSEWRPAANDATPWVEVDFGKLLRFGGLVIRWPEAVPPQAFRVSLSADSEVWERLYQATSACGGLTHIPAPRAEARYLKVDFDNAEYAALRSITLRPDVFTRTPNEFLHAVAGDFPRGSFPRYWLRKQSYWTTVGSPEGKRRALLSEDGAVEIDEAGFSLEPFVLTPQGAVTWADVKSVLVMPKGGIPMPSVTWLADGFQLDILPWVDGHGDGLALRATYRLTCRKEAIRARLVIAVRPYQVNPPWQAFRNLGGRSLIHRIRCCSNGLHVDGRVVYATPPPDAHGTAAFEEGEIPFALSQGAIPKRQVVDDPSGLASAEMAWDLPSGKSTLEVTVSVPYFEHAQLIPKGDRAKVLACWRRKLGAVKWKVPACAAPAIDCIRTAAGHILINRDGPAIQPGPRRYTRSWVRDCVIMGAALAKAGIPEALRTFLIWYAQFQREDGFVPCVVDRAGTDWLIEHDSHGEFLWGIRESFRTSGNRQFLSRMLPFARKAADYLIAVRAERMTGLYRTAEHAACYGLLPESASHEGYLAHPVHAYWDDFWGVRGLEAAADLAEAAGLAEDACRWRSEAPRFQADILRSLAKVISDKQLTYIPGSVEWADFDPTATANAIALLDFADVLPKEPMLAMLDTYLNGLRRKQCGETPWNNYSAYEIRIIGAMVRLGKRDVANELLGFFLSDRRPREWNQWPEITWRDPRAPGHLGDLPHTWIAAEYLLALTSMVAAEREASSSLVLASGMPWEWIAEDGGFSVRDLPTRYGPLDFMICADSEDTIRVRIGDSIRLPPGGLTLVPPLPTGRRIVLVSAQEENHKVTDLPGTAIVVTRLPFAADLHLG